MHSPDPLVKSFTVFFRFVLKIDTVMQKLIFLSCHNETYCNWKLSHEPTVHIAFKLLVNWSSSHALCHFGTHKLCINMSCFLWLSGLFVEVYNAF